MTNQKICDKCGNELKDDRIIEVKVRNMIFHFCNTYCLEFGLNKIKKARDEARDDKLPNNL